jgi:hypothetical protein
VLSSAGLPVSYFPGTQAGSAAAQSAASGIMGTVLAMEQGSITGGSTKVTSG